MESELPAAAKGQSPSTKVVEKVAEQEGVGPCDLDSLYDVVNPDALDALFAPTSNATVHSGGHVEFTYCGYDITVKSDGHVLVSPSGDRS